MQELLNLLGADRYIAHSASLTNDPLIIWLYLGSNGVTVASFFILSLVFFFSPFTPVQVRPTLRMMFGLFIFLGAISHMTEIATLYYGIYPLDVFFTSITAAVAAVITYFSVSDAIVVYRANSKGKKSITAKEETDGSAI